MRKLIITEEQERKLIEILNEEIYQMPVDRKANKPYCVNPEKVLIVKNFLDKGFTAHDYEKIGADGMPSVIKIISMNASITSSRKLYSPSLTDFRICSATGTRGTRS